MNLQIAIMNLAILGILIWNFRYLKDSKRLNSKVFYAILIITFVLITVEYMLSITPIDGYLGITKKFWRFILYLVIPLYPALSAIFAETWLIESDNLPKRFMALMLVPHFINDLNIIYWALLSDLTFNPENMFHNIHGIIFLLTSFYPLVFVCIKIAIYRHKWEFRSLLELIFIIIPVSVGGIIQVLNFNVSTFMSGAVISQLLIFFYLLNGHSFTDPLTHLYNRRYLNRHFKSIQNSEKYKLACILIDVDHFKKINDINGHDVGDKVLIEVSQLLHRSTHIKDTVYRLGGDEFLVLTQVHDVQELEKIVSRIRMVLGHLNESHLFPFEISLSLGAYIENESDGMSLEVFLKKADEAMYIEKSLHHKDSL